LRKCGRQQLPNYAFFIDIFMLSSPELDLVESCAVLHALSCSCQQLLHHVRLLPCQVDGCAV
jgi:hypothetical protein